MEVLLDTLALLLMGASAVFGFFVFILIFIVTVEYILSRWI